MTISKIKNGTRLTVLIEGKLDSMTAPELEEFLNDELDGVKQLVFDFDKLQYISSAGLRVLLSACKRISKADGSMKLINVDDNVEDILIITGFKRAFAFETKGGRVYNPDLS